MDKEIKRVIDRMVQMGWITINPQLNEDVLTAGVIEIIKDMKLRDYLDLFTPKF